MIKLAVFDIDRTLIQPEIGAIAPETAAALKQLQQKGIKTAIASGRLFSFLQPELLELGFDYFIMSNGCYVTDPSGNILAREKIDEAVLEAFSRRMIQENLPFLTRYCMGQREGNPAAGTVRERMATVKSKHKFKGKPPKAFTEQYEPAPGELPICACGYFPDTARQMFESEFPQLTFMPMFEGPMCDINPATVSKASGVRRICEMLGIDICETIAFGDDRNDLEMITEAGIGVAMGDGLDAVIAAADYVTEPCADLGVVKALKHFGLLD